MKIKSGASVFLVKDVQASAAYFRDAVGFRFDRFWGDPPGFCMVWRDEQCIMLSQVDEPGLIRPVSSVVPVVWDAYFWVDDVEAFHADLCARGARIECAPFAKPYGVKEFVVVDLDGHRLAFGEELLDDTRSD
jgi:catechol 2,3-dioxygenase-like lactoylglutathione lyase family enzyme